MTGTTETLPAETGGTDITRFNALRHGVLSRYTVLPWEDANEYRAVVEALLSKAKPALAPQDACDLLDEVLLCRPMRAMLGHQ